MTDLENLNINNETIDRKGEIENKVNRNKVNRNQVNDKKENKVQENGVEEKNNSAIKEKEKEKEKENKDEDLDININNSVITNNSVMINNKLKPIKDNYKILLLLSLEFGFLFMLCFYDFYINFNGIMYPLFVIGLFGFAYFTLKVINRTIKKNTYFYAIVALLLGISSFITMNWFIVMLNTLGIIILFTIFLCKQFFDDSEWGILYYFTNIIIVWLKAIPCTRYIIKHGLTYLKPLKNKRRKWIPVFKGILFGGIFLSIVIPLLASADMIFREFVVNIFSIFENPFSGEWNYYLFLVIIAMLMFYGLLCSFVSGGVNHKVKLIKKKEPTSAVVMTGIITVTYLLFCGIQIVYLFGGNFLTLPNGITYAQYAHQGFFQLLFVVMINVGMVVLCVKKFEEHKGLKKLLSIISICTFIMIASAMYRMLLYISVYHLTFLRVLVIWFLITLTILMIGVVYYIYHDTYKIDKFFFQSVLFCYLILAFMRPDYMIAKYNISHMETIKMEDASYLLFNLSYDATPVLAKIDTTKFDVGENVEVSYDETDIRNYIDGYFDNICSTYDHKFRSFNISKYFAYQAAKNYRDGY